MKYCIIAIGIRPVLGQLMLFKKAQYRNETFRKLSSRENNKGKKSKDNARQRKIDLKFKPGLYRQVSNF